jgi:hypothetical protein
MEPEGAAQVRGAVSLFLQQEIKSTAGVMKTGGPGRSRTADLRFRKPSLYPSELRGLYMNTI